MQGCHVCLILCHQKQAGKGAVQVSDAILCCYLFNISLIPNPEFLEWWCTKLKLIWTVKPSSQDRYANGRGEIHQVTYIQSIPRSCFLADTEMLLSQTIPVCSWEESESSTSIINVSTDVNLPIIAAPKLSCQFLIRKFMWCWNGRRPVWN